MSDRGPDDRERDEARDDDRPGTDEPRAGREAETADTRTDAETTDTEAERRERTDAEVRDERTDPEARTDERVASGEGTPPDEGETDSDDGAGLSGGLAILVSAIVALAVTALAYWWVGRFGGGVFFEELFRIAPTVEDGGVGADWIVGNTVPWLDALIAIVHAADVLMGVFILAMVFLHWAAFRRLASRMRRPVTAEERGAVATDGGAQATADDRRATDGGATGQSSGGEDR